MSRELRHVISDIVQSAADGNFDEALALCRSKLADAPDDINLLALLGAVLIRAGYLDEAEQNLRRAIELEGGFAKPHEDLGMLYLERGDNEQAIPLLEKAIVLAGPQASTVRALAAALHRCGRTDDVDALCAAHPQYAPAALLLARADELRKVGDLQAAEASCQRVLQSDAGNVAAQRLLATIAGDAQRYDVAENLLRKIVSQAPENLAAVYDLARFLGERGRYPEVIDLLESAVAANEENAEVRQSLGDILAIVGRSADALQAYEKCLLIKPDDPASLLGRANMLRIEGRSDEAVASYLRCLEVRPDIGDAWWSLSTMRDYKATDEDIAVMRANINNPETAPDSQIAFRFALATAFERRADYEGAWEQYVKGNAAKRSLVKYDPVETETRTSVIKAVFTSALVGEKHANTPPDNTPVFIVGMPRSGSTLIEQILASHSSVAGCGELSYIIMLSNSAAATRPDGVVYPEVVKDLDESQLTGLGRSYLYYAMQHNKEGRPFFTDKMPANFPHVGFIRQILPHAKIIDARRNPLATCVANYRQLFAQGKNQSYDLTELGEYYLQYIDMMNHWDEVLPGAVLRVQYEDVVADVETQVRRMLDYCELPFEQACIDFHRSQRPVNTASSEQVRQPLYQSGVDFWKHYDAHLAELREILAPIR